jgi:aminopeptidase YwaD
LDDERPDSLAEAMRGHVEALCALGGDRHPGTARNRAATDYVADALAASGLEVEALGFEVPEWRYGTASARVGERVIDAQPGPFSPPCEGSGRLVAASHRAELSNLDLSGAVLLLHGEIARKQLVPRHYPWYSDPDDAQLLDAIEAAAPLAVIAATGKSPETTGALSPFPLIEDVGFAVPSAYITESDGQVLLTHVGEPVSVQIDSSTSPSTGVQLIGRLPGTEPGRIVIGAHVDTKPDTPGALDNAAGVATLLGVAQLLAGMALRHTVEFVPFNGEDHAASPGEVAYLSAYPDLSDVRLMMNIDDAGLLGGPTDCSAYGLDERAGALVAEIMDEFGSVTEGPQWPSSDHMIFAMRGVPALALTARDLGVVMSEISHTTADTPDRVDAQLLADAARFIAAVAEGL